MKKFKFRLQKLLDIREAAEKGAKNELAEVMSIQNRERQKQDELRDSIDRHRSHFRERLIKGDFTPKEAIFFEKYVNISQRAIELSDERILQLEPEVIRRRGKVIEASKERKTVEKLKEKKLNSFNYQYNWEINKENDDMNQKIYQKRMSASGEQ